MCVLTGKACTCNDYTLIASDELWNPDNKKLHGGGGRLPRLFSQHGRTPTVAYAPSMHGISGASLQSHRGALSGGLRTLSNISVRDTHTQSVLRSMGFDVPTVMDPTFLMRAHWRRLAATTTTCADKQGPYMATSLYQMNKDYPKGLSCQALKDYPHRFVNTEVGATVTEWLRLLHGAEKVATNTFHGTVFSIILKKDFVVLQSRRKPVGEKTLDLLNRVGLRARLLSCWDSWPSSPIDYAVVGLRLDSFVAESEAWLDSAIDCRRDIGTCSGSAR